MCLSVPQMAAAVTRISTSSGPGFGTGQSRICVPATPSTGADLTTACIKRSVYVARTLSQRFARLGAAKMSPHVLQETLEGRRIAIQRARLSRKVTGKTIHGPDQR